MAPGWKEFVIAEIAGHFLSIRQAQQNHGKAPCGIRAIDISVERHAVAHLGRNVFLHFNAVLWTACVRHTMTLLCQSAISGQQSAFSCQEGKGVYLWTSDLRLLPVLLKADG